MQIAPPNHDKIGCYCAESVQSLWERSIENDSCFFDPFIATCDSDYRERYHNSVKALKDAERQRHGFKYSFDKGLFRSTPFSEQKILDPLLRFESRMAKITHSFCMTCRECSISLQTNKKSDECIRCCRASSKGAYSRSNIMVPTWEDRQGNVHYNVPAVLSKLTIAEVLLIQRVSPLVPIVHIRNGTLGIKGHVCSFLQDISSVAQVLPRLPQDIKAVKFVKTFTDSNSDHQTRMYLVNRKRVMAALAWLTEHHVEYRKAYQCGELIININNLNWLGDKEEAELESVQTLTRRLETAQDVDGHQLQVSKIQYEEDQMNMETECSGVLCKTDSSVISQEQEKLLESLKDAANTSNKIPVLDWPQQSCEPISEFGETVKIFVNAFPHLFPGGNADVNEHDRAIKVSESDWAKHLLYQKDGRFVRDKIWCFFALNYCARRRNIQDGSYFVDGHISSPPMCLDQLKNQIQEGDTSFINKLMFYSKRTRGSDAFWRYKRAELYNWIHYHVTMGHGPPNIFMTLSCAEYFWPDMVRLLEERIWLADGETVNSDGVRCYRSGQVIDLSNDKTALNKAVNDYSIVVQEFFITRTIDYLNTVGRDVLGIKHYWMRFEFAKGRGQIHAHLLAILDTEVVKDLQRQIDAKHVTSEQEAKLVSDWAADRFGMTATMNTKAACSGPDSNREHDSVSPE